MLTYTTYYQQLANLMVVQPSSAPLLNTEFATFLPGCIDYVEQRAYRELDVVGASITDASGALTAQDRDFQLPTTLGTFLVLENVNVITPATALSSNGTRHPLAYVTPTVIDTIYPSNTLATGLPQYYSRLNSSSIVVGPVPDAPYAMEVRGTQRPTPLSAGNPTTYLSITYPDLLIAGSMVFASAYMRNFSAEGDNPQMAVGWEEQYNKLKASALSEEQRKTFESEGWTSQSPTPATPPRV